MYIQKREEATLKEFREQDKMTEGKRKYNFDEIVNNLHLVNAGILVSTRGEEAIITKEMLYNPYFGHASVYGDSKSYIKDTSGDVPKRVLVSLGRVLKQFVDENYEYFANVLPGLTKLNLYKVIYTEKRQRIAVWEQRRLINMVVDRKVTAFSSNQDRLYPLQDYKYHQFARKLYLKHKSPMFGKRFVDGVQFGAQEMKMYSFGLHIPGSSQPWKRMGVDSRQFGLRVVPDTNNKLRLAYVVDMDGIYVIRKQHGGKRHHLWEKIYGGGLYAIHQSRRNIMARGLFYGHGSRKYAKMLYEQMEDKANIQAERRTEVADER